MVTSWTHGVCARVPSTWRRAPTSGFRVRGIATRKLRATPGLSPRSAAVSATNRCVVSAPSAGVVVWVDSRLRTSSQASRVTPDPVRRGA